MKVTAHFTVEEFAQHARRGFDAKPYPEAWIDTRLRPLCGVLEWVREAVGAPIVIVSGYRSPGYNQEIGGARQSQHVCGRAADIRVACMSARQLHAVVLNLYRRDALPALGGLGLYPSFVHVDIRLQPPAPASPRLVRWTGGRKTS